MKNGIERRGSGIPNWIQRSTKDTIADPEGRTNGKKVPASIPYMINRK